MEITERILSYMQTAAYKPLTAEELMRELGGDNLDEFFKVLYGLEQAGKIVCTRRMRYGLPEKLNLIVGKLQGHQDGFGFLIPDRAGQDDVFIGADSMNGAMHGDRVIARFKGTARRGNREEGEIIRILQRKSEKVVGTFEQDRQHGFVVPDEKRLAQDIFIPKGMEQGAKTGDKVVVEITRWPEKRRNAEGKVTQIIGAKGEPGTDIESIIWKFSLPREFPKDVMHEVEKIAPEVNPADIEGREDLRNLLMVTIDGEDAKDLDDAVSLEILPNGNYMLGVHIADVGHYVTYGSALDKEAYQRATSVYLVDRAIPMLPKELSNGICSLNPRVDRLTQSVFMEIDADGKVVNNRVVESVIKTNERMTYGNVTRILVDRDPELRQRYDYLVETFENMEKLCLILRKRRLDRGAIDFDFPEVKVKLDERGRPVDIVKQERGIADRIIEEFMLVANETIAERYFWMEVPFMYRVHEEPDEEKLTHLNLFLANFGLGLKGIKKIRPRAFQDIVTRVEGRPEQRVVNTILLRSMKQARYSEENLGHFGLAAKFYTHFTSPIRRYPDLVIHRIIKEIIRQGSLSDKRRAKLVKFLPDAAVQSSERERLAMEAERDSVDLKKVEFMQDKVGQEFDAIISSVTPFGMFVELENLVEGLVHVTTLHDDFYEFVENQYSLVGRHTRRIFRIGQQVRVQLTRVNIDERQLDFELLE
ncbi:MAG: ribonuclease R [Bacillota bacterium]